jgi:AcrR family transcriptional regulator
VTETDRERGVAVDGRTRRWENHRRALLRAATEYVLDTGVAEKIGTSITSLVRQFGSKDELVHDICRDLQARMAAALRERWRATAGDPAEVLRALWQMWLAPEYMRQFAFLFELYGLALRHPERYEWFADSVVEQWMTPFEEALIAQGHDVSHARNLTTLVLGIVRGLHLDLAATREVDRVNAAFNFALQTLQPALAAPSAALRADLPARGARDA